MVINDKNNGMPLFKCELPDDFKTQGWTEMKTYPQSQRIYLQIEAKRGNCNISFHSGESYIYEKKMFQIMTQVPKHQLGTQNETGAWYAEPTSLRDDLDAVASSLVNKKLTTETYFDLSKKVEEGMRKGFKEMIDQFVDDLQFEASLSAVPIGVDIRNYLFDGGVGVYEDKGKIIASCLVRMGMEIDMLQRGSIMENITGEEFGKASDSPYVLGSTCSWSTPFIATMISDNKEDLKVFMNFIESAENSEELKNSSKQLSQQLNYNHRQQAQMSAMQNQAMWNNMFMQQEQRWNAVRNMQRSMSQDLDNWRASQAQMRAQSDMRFQTPGTQFESSDDRIQRMRHESMMGVETYERNDGSTVEYSNMADRVFENNLDNTVHFGTHNYYDDYIPEGWHEMKKK